MVRQNFAEGMGKYDDHLKICESLFIWCLARWTCHFVMPTNSIMVPKQRALQRRLAFGNGDHISTDSTVLFLKKDAIFH